MTVTSSTDHVDAIRASLAEIHGDIAADYLLLRTIDEAYVARTRKGLASIVLPLASVPSAAVGRRTSGIELIAHSSAHFVDGARTWFGPAAALVCVDTDLIESFAVLAADVLQRTIGARTWTTTVAAVEEWLSLLTPRGSPSVEAEIGLWGELWFLNRSNDLARLLTAWRGPEGDTTDFFCDGVAAEIKTSRARLCHFVSQAQVQSPVGNCPAWLLSIWVKLNPSDDVTDTVPALVDAILARAPDKAEALKRIARAGYSPADRRAYTSAFRLLEEPHWFDASVVPRVRQADAGVSRLRYQIMLDESLRADGSTAKHLWRHFHQHPYELEA